MSVAFSVVYKAIYCTYILFCLVCNAFSYVTRPVTRLVRKLHRKPAGKRQKERTTTIGSIAIKRASTTLTWWQNGAIYVNGGFTLHAYRKRIQKSSPFRSCGSYYILSTLVERILLNTSLLESAVSKLSTLVERLLLQTSLLESAVSKLPTLVERLLLKTSLLESSVSNLSTLVERLLLQTSLLDSVVSKFPTLVERLLLHTSLLELAVSCRH